MDDAIHDSRLGRPVAAYDAPFPGDESLHGDRVTLERLSPHHIDDLYDCIGGPLNEALWTYTPVGPFLDPPSFHEYITTCIRDRSIAVYAIIDARTSRAVGTVGLLRLEPANRACEVGYITFSSSLQRTRASTETLYLLISNVFDRLGYRRCAWQCNDLNEPSKRGAMRVGFTYEGTWRQARVLKGANRDTAWYSMLDSEWPGVKRAFEAWLGEDNFEGDGRQKRTLAEVRTAGSI